MWRVPALAAAGLSVAFAMWLMGNASGGFATTWPDLFAQMVS